jgi:hypothetical protein
MRAKTIKEEQNFERGLDPKASMEVGGINLQESFDKMFDDWISVFKIFEGKTITGNISKYWTDKQHMPREDTKKRSVKVKKMDIKPNLVSMGGKSCNILEYLF